MNTPTHILINYITLRKHVEHKSDTYWIAAGAILPDIAIFVLFFYALIAGIPQNVVWDTLYFLPGWQNAIDIFNSIPISVLIIGIAMGLKWRGGILFGVSTLLHVFFDFFLHHDDAHRHFFPLSDYRFESPVSYWDPAHYGALGAGIEFALVILIAVLLWRHGASRFARIGSIVYIALFVVMGILAPMVFS